MSPETLKLTPAGEQPVPARKKNKTGRWVLAGAVIVAVAAVFFGLRLISSESRTPAATPENTSAITVTVVHPAAVSGGTLQLSGYTQAYTEAPIYAQTSGYLKKWNFDIGGKVHAGDVLGEIDTPEVDQELAQAKAQLQVAQAASHLAEVTYQRDQSLFDQKVLDAETRDSAADTYAEDQATVVADQANLDRLDALEAFKVLRAPFDGIVTARNVDVGTYVANGSGTQLFVVAQISPLRIYVQVPQADAQSVKIGMEADLTLPQFPGRTLQARVTNIADVIDPSSRSLLTQLQIPNTSGELLPGAYAQITFKFAGASPFLTIPENTLIFRREGAAVGVVDSNGKVEIHKITIDNDFGDELEISKGLSTTDQVILDPSDSLATGMTAKIQPAPPEEKK
ncbi:MAG: efflux RND transporter periplasmic adaptor subunit [Verrucomicrobia bacterium]|nr:efflux RND transporter periplasmic adaptor subunit [Verrucomicrobiota bacterium]